VIAALGVETTMHEAPGWHAIGWFAACGLGGGVALSLASTAFLWRRASGEWALIRFGGATLALVLLPALAFLPAVVALAVEFVVIVAVAAVEQVLGQRGKLVVPPQMRDVGGCCWTIRMEELPVVGSFESEADLRVEYAIAHAEFGRRAAAQAAAELLLGIHGTLEEARRDPALFVGEAFRGDDAVAFAERSATADLAMRLRMSESTVRLQADRARVLIGSLPSIWAGLCEGEVGARNAETAADLAATLPPGAVRTAFDDALVRAARECTPARFRDRARRLREELDPAPLTERHAAARELRRVEIEKAPDGMVWLSAFLDAADGMSIRRRLDASARDLSGAPDERRTLDQLRADVFADLLLRGGTNGVPAVTSTVAVTVPVLALLGEAQLPGTLEGYGPIDAETARRLAARAPSFQRILTHPITGTVLDVDRTSYRPPADLVRWLRIRDERCTAPGCGRPAAECDLDHREAWAAGGGTSAGNLAHLCRSHHRLKHEGGWTVRAGPGGTTTWISPTGHRTTVDPPPF